MSEDNAIRYIELSATSSGEMPRDPTLPSACKTGGCGCGSGGGQVPIPMPAFATVRVNGVEIVPEDIAREMQHHPAADGEIAWHHAARALAIRELLLQEAAACQLDGQREADTADDIETEEAIRIGALLERELPSVSVAEEECQRYYDGHTHRFRTPDMFEAAHILIEPVEDSDNGWLEAEQRAKEIASKLGNDAALFAAAAREFSGCPTGRQDGSLGQVRRGELDPAVQQALEALSERCTARQPVRSRFGWHVVRLHRRISGQTLPFELAREKILDMLEARAWVTSASKYITKLTHAASIEGVQINPLDTNAVESESPVP